MLRRQLLQHRKHHPAGPAPAGTEVHKHQLQGSSGRTVVAGQGAGQGSGQGHAGAGTETERGHNTCAVIPPATQWQHEPCLPACPPAPRSTHLAPACRPCQDGGQLGAALGQGVHAPISIVIRHGCCWLLLQLLQLLLLSSMLGVWV